MRVLFFLLPLMILFMAAIGCTPSELPDGSDGDDTELDAEVSETPEAIPADDPGPKPGDDMTTTLMDSVSLEEFVKAVITNDMEAVKALSSNEIMEDIDKLITDIGFREFAEDDDYEALWEKISPLGVFSLTGLSSGHSIGVWAVMGEEAGLKNIQVQFELVSEDDILKVTGYEVVSSE